jgi:hypothetical protein
MGYSAGISRELGFGAAFRRHRKPNQVPEGNQSQSQLIALCMLSEHWFGKVGKSRQEQKSAHYRNRRYTQNHCK